MDVGFNSFLRRVCMSLRGLSFRVLFAAGFSLSVMSCADKPDTNSVALPVPFVAPVFTIHVVCSARFTENQRYSHMLRITKALDYVEFTGGFGLRVFVSESASVELVSGKLIAKFPVGLDMGTRAFELSIDRRTLAYLLSYAVGPSGVLEGGSKEVLVKGLCNQLDGSGFKL